MFAWELNEDHLEIPEAVSRLALAGHGAGRRGPGAAGSGKMKVMAGFILLYVLGQARAALLGEEG
jgi:hypothetical protein